MKLPIKKQYFDEIKKGLKIIEYRDAHISFIPEDDTDNCPFCNGSGKKNTPNNNEFKKDVDNVMLISRKFLDREMQPMFDDKQIIAFKLR
mgnify:CR=1 FL=1